MKVTVVVDEVGEVVASTQAHGSEHAARIGRGATPDGPIAFATLIANAGQTIHELTVPDDFERLDASEFHARLMEHLPEEARRGTAD